MSPAWSYDQLVKCGGAGQNQESLTRGFCWGNPDVPPHGERLVRDFAFQPSGRALTQRMGRKWGRTQETANTVRGRSQVARGRTERIRGARLIQHARGSHCDIAGPLRRCDPLPLFASQRGSGSLSCDPCIRGRTSARAGWLGQSRATVYRKTACRKIGVPICSAHGLDQTHRRHSGLRAKPAADRREVRMRAIDDQRLGERHDERAASLARRSVARAALRDAQREA